MWEAPDMAMVVDKGQRHIVDKELHSLWERGSFYYEVYDSLSPKTPNAVIFILFFDDAIIDAAAEVYKIKGRMKEYDCITDFKSYAR